MFKTPISAGKELSLLAAGLMVVSVAVMWADRRDGTCATAPDPPRRLVLTEQTDGEHLATDLDSAARIARRYGSAAAAPDDQRARVLQCEAQLADAIATTHGLSPDDVRDRLRPAR